MQVAVIQHDIVWQDGVATTSHLAPLVAQAAAEGARLVVLTEMFATGFSMRTELIAEPPGGPIEQWLVAQARQHGIHLLGSIAQIEDPRRTGGERRDPGRPGRPDRTLREDAPVHVRQRARALPRRAKRRSRWTSRASARASSSATTYVSPTTSGYWRTTPTATSWWPTGPSRDVNTGGRCCGPGRSRTRPTSSRPTGSAWRVPGGARAVRRATTSDGGTTPATQRSSIPSVARWPRRHTSRRS